MPNARKARKGYGYYYIHKADPTISTESQTKISTPTDFNRIWGHYNTSGSTTPAFFVNIQFSDNNLSKFKLQIRGNPGAHGYYDNYFKVGARYGSNPNNNTRVNTNGSSKIFYESSQYDTSAYAIIDSSNNTKRLFIYAWCGQNPCYPIDVDGHDGRGLVKTAIAQIYLGVETPPAPVEDYALYPRIDAVTGSEITVSATWTGTNASKVRVYLCKNDSSRQTSDSTPFWDLTTKGIRGAKKFTGLPTQTSTNPDSLGKENIYYLKFVLYDTSNHAQVTNSRCYAITEKIKPYIMDRGYEKVLDTDGYYKNRYYIHYALLQYKAIRYFPDIDAGGTFNYNSHIDSSISSNYTAFDKYEYFIRKPGSGFRCFKQLNSLCTDLAYPEDAGLHNETTTGVGYYFTPVTPINPNATTPSPVELYSGIKAYNYITDDRGTAAVLEDNTEYEFVCKIADTNISIDGTTIKKQGRASMLVRSKTCRLPVFVSNSIYNCSGTTMTMRIEFKNGNNLHDNFNIYLSKTANPSEDNYDAKFSTPCDDTGDDYRAIEDIPSEYAYLTMTGLNNKTSYNMNYVLRPDLSADYVKDMDGNDHNGGGILGTYTYGFTTNNGLATSSKCVKSNVLFGLLKDGVVKPGKIHRYIKDLLYHKFNINSDGDVVYNIPYSELNTTNDSELFIYRNYKNTVSLDGSLNRSNTADYYYSSNSKKIYLNKDKFNKDKDNLLLYVYLNNIYLYRIDSISDSPIIINDEKYIMITLDNALPSDLETAKYDILLYRYNKYDSETLLFEGIEYENNTTDKIISITTNDAAVYGSYNGTANEKEIYNTLTDDIIIKAINIEDTFESSSIVKIDNGNDYYIASANSIYFNIDLTTYQSLNIYYNNRLMDSSEYTISYDNEESKYIAIFNENIFADRDTRYFIYFRALRIVKDGVTLHGVTLHEGLNRNFISNETALEFKTVNPPDGTEVLRHDDVIYTHNAYANIYKPGTIETTVNDISERIRYDISTELSPDDYYKQDYFTRLNDVIENTQFRLLELAIYPWPPNNPNAPYPAELTCGQNFIKYKCKIGLYNATEGHPQVLTTKDPIDNSLYNVYLIPIKKSTCPEDDEYYDNGYNYESAVSGIIPTVQIGEQDITLTYNNLTSWTWYEFFVHISDGAYSGDILSANNQVSNIIKCHTDYPYIRIYDEASQEWKKYIAFIYDENKGKYITSIPNINNGTNWEEIDGSD